jgi:hypothetical protein
MSAGSMSRKIEGPLGERSFSHHQVNDSEQDDPVAVKVPTALAHV